MISFNFEYVRPSTIGEAVECYRHLNRSGKRVLYYSGGTEILSLARKQALKVDVIIDIKDIPECRGLYRHQQRIIYGAAVTLNEIIEDNKLPLFTSIFKGIADHTLRNRLTLGGNICSYLSYKEAVLPLMLVEAEVRIAGVGGIRRERFNRVFDKRLGLDKGELLIDVAVEEFFEKAEFYNIRKEKHGKVDYPLMHIALLRDKGLRAAFSGVCSFPFRSDAIDAILNDTVDIDEKISGIIKCIPGRIKQDQWASGHYRKMLLEKALSKAYIKLGGAALD